MRAISTLRIIFLRENHLCFSTLNKFFFSKTSYFRKYAIYKTASYRPYRSNIAALGFYFDSASSYEENDRSMNKIGSETKEWDVPDLKKKHPVYMLKFGQNQCFTLSITWPIYKKEHNPKCVIGSIMEARSSWEVILLACWMTKYNDINPKLDGWMGFHELFG